MNPLDLNFADPNLAPVNTVVFEDPPRMRNLTPKVFLGALASVVDKQLTTVVRFQYNPESVTRTLTPAFDSPNKGTRAKGAFFKDAPKQAISFKAWFDAADALASGDRTAAAAGIAPQLAMLETLAYPSRATVREHTKSAAEGAMRIVPFIAPRTVLIWGSNRVFPVRITSLAITEEAFDAGLNPVRASATIGLDVQTYGDRDPSDEDYGRFVAYHQSLENMAARVPTALTAKLQALLRR